MRSCSTASPRLSSSRTSARRNWCPPPAGGGSKSWNSARSARSRRERRRSELRAQRVARPSGPPVAPPEEARGRPRGDTLASSEPDAFIPSPCRRLLTTADSRSARGSACSCGRAATLAPRPTYRVPYGAADLFSRARRLRRRLGDARRASSRTGSTRPTTRSRRPRHRCAQGVLRGLRTRPTARASVISYEPEDANARVPRAERESSYALRAAAGSSSASRWADGRATPSCT